MPNAKPVERHHKARILFTILLGCVAFAVLWHFFVIGTFWHTSGVYKQSQSYWLGEKIQYPDFSIVFTGKVTEGGGYSDVGYIPKSTTDLFTVTDFVRSFPIRSMEFDPKPPHSAFFEANGDRYMMIREESAANYHGSMVIVPLSPSIPDLTARTSILPQKERPSFIREFAFGWAYFITSDGSHVIKIVVRDRDGTFVTLPDTQESTLTKFDTDWQLKRFGSIYEKSARLDI